MSLDDSEGWFQYPLPSEYRNLHPVSPFSLMSRPHAFIWTWCALQALVDGCRRRRRSGDHGLSAYAAHTLLSRIFTQLMHQTASLHSRKADRRCIVHIRVIPRNGAREKHRKLIRPEISQEIFLKPSHATWGLWHMIYREF